ncbi:ERI1 exoribonuclease 2 isoform X1 [Podarcis lilfordi]|uniref:ERI1 exoribonuclease 2 isoform X1 n=1 Tax=Podarcis lilfordi TaxID=74358 RepID=A0AA35QQD5_9SAUR|nr:ERI1 exoribonuclease 2 isoform X1 [Podarcis lilfordi]
MATKKLARQLGIIRRISKTSPGGQNHGKPKLRQLFDYLIIIDFESTCWKEGRKCYTQEIIEFPAVLLNTLNGEIESEFHMYVQPQEHPILSEFCTELTGIKQQLRKPDVLNSWIDLRATYKLFYCRKPRGLNGALQDVGIIFAGREHSGLDDSRNTARLAWKMICDGCVMKITKSLDKAPPVKNSIARFLSPKPTEGSPLGSNDGAGMSCLDESKMLELPQELKTTRKTNSKSSVLFICIETPMFCREMPQRLMDIVVSKAA